MTAITFDTLAFANKLKAAGVAPVIAEAQAVAQAEVFTHMVDNHLATKNDIKGLQNEIELLRRELIIKMGSMSVATIGILATLMVLLHLH